VKLSDQALADANKAEAAALDAALRPILVELAGKTLRTIAAELAAVRSPPLAAALGIPSQCRAC
jgi:hypothetical protein